MQKLVLLNKNFLFLLSQASALKGSDHRRATDVSARLDAQQKKLKLPVLPTTTIGSFPQTMDLRRVRREYKAKKWVLFDNSPYFGLLEIDFHISLFYALITPFSF